MAHKRDISNSADILDSRDIITRIEELQSAREALVDEVTALSSDEVEHAEDEADREQQLATRAADKTLASEALEAWDEDNGDELKALEALADEASGSPDWPHGEALIRDSYFKDYAQELAEDSGAVNKNATWPNNCIDWDEASELLQQDYTSVDFDGVTYWIRG